jgi:hypothetical protein
MASTPPSYVLLLPTSVALSINRVNRYSNAAELFKVACDSFRDNLPVNDKEEFKEYKDAQSMISTIQELANNHPVHRTRLTAACRKLHGFTSKLEPYFDIVNVFVQVKPEYLGLVWGSMRMIFQVGHMGDLLSLMFN